MLPGEISRGRTIVVLTLMACVLLAGCAGWGTDAPSEGEDAENDEGDDLEEADGEADDDGEEAPNAGENETNGSDREEGNESPPPEDDGEGEPAEEYASPDEIRLAGVTHMESESGLDHDEITLSNTNNELPLPIGGWEVETDGSDQRISIEEGVVIEPGGTYTIQSPEGEKVLNEDGGVIRLYDADGDRVGSWDHVGSPSAPPAASNAEDVGYVQVMVLDARNGEGVEDAEVVLTNESGETLDGTTDGAGVTTVREVPYGEYELTITHDEYADHDETIVVDEEGTETTIELDPSETVTRTSAVEPTSTVVVRSSLHTPS